jgi:hypothetical protein
LTLVDLAQDIRASRALIPKITTAGPDTRNATLSAGATTGLKDYEANATASGSGTCDGDQSSKDPMASESGQTTASDTLATTGDGQGTSAPSLPAANTLESGQTTASDAFATTGDANTLESGQMTASDACATTGDAQGTSAPTVVTNSVAPAIDTQPGAGTSKPTELFKIPPTVDPEPFIFLTPAQLAAIAPINPTEADSLVLNDDQLRVFAPLLKDVLGNLEDEGIPSQAEESAPKVSEEIVHAPGLRPDTFSCKANTRY